MKRILAAAVMILLVLSSCKSADENVSSENTRPVSSAFHSEPQTKEEIKAPRFASYMYYRSLLSEKSQTAYDKISESLYRFEGSVSLGSFSLTENEVSDIVRAVLRDDPYLFFVDNSFNISFVNSSVSGVSFKFIMSKEEYEKSKSALDAECDKIVSTLGGKSDYEKIVGIHDALCRKVNYRKAENCYNAVGAVVNGSAVCQGYTHAAMLLMYKSDIPCIFAEGTFGGNSHSWVMAKADGEWYHVDITADDPENSEDGMAVFHTFALITDEEMSGSHSFRGYPAAKSKKHNYYVAEGLYMTEFDKDTLCNIIADAKKADKKYVSVRFGSKDALDTAKKRFSAGDLSKGVKARYGGDVALSTVTMGAISGIYDITFKIE